MKPRFLIINDDGIHAPGIRHLYQAVKDYADCFIVAPLAEKSGSGLSMTLTKPLKITPTYWDAHLKVWHVNGTPADCVKLALNSLLQVPPDLIISGINRGSNAGRNVLYSGTIGGVIEGVYRNNLPGIAFSCSDFKDPNYAHFEKYVYPIIQHFLKHPISPGSLMNVNFPSLSLGKIQGIRIAKQGKGFWTDSPDKRIHPEGDPYFWLGGTWRSYEEDLESDVYLLEQGYITCAPIQINELTDHLLFSKHKPLFEETFEALMRQDLDLEEVSE